MIWGCFSWYGVGRMYICEKAVNQTEYIRILETRALPSIRDMTEEFGLESITFQDDSAPAHRAKAVSNKNFHNTWLFQY